jgi:hypothetical protein
MTQVHKLVGTGGFLAVAKLYRENDYNGTKRKNKKYRNQEGSLATGGKIRSGSSTRLDGICGMEAEMAVRLRVGRVESSNQKKTEEKVC